MISNHCQGKFLHTSKTLEQLWTSTFTWPNAHPLELINFWDVEESPLPAKHTHSAKHVHHVAQSLTMILSDQVEPISIKNLHHSGQIPIKSQLALKSILIAHTEWFKREHPTTQHTLQITIWLRSLDWCASPILCKKTQSFLKDNTIKKSASIKTPSTLHSVTGVLLVVQFLFLKPTLMTLGP